MLSVGLQLDKGLQVLNPKPADSWAGPYASVAEANASVPLSVRFVGRDVIIQNGDVASLYWWNNGIADVNLVLKLATYYVIDDASAGTGKLYSSAKIEALFNAFSAVERTVATIAARDALTGLKNSENIFVQDATGDPSVLSGWAIYKYILAASTFVKIAENEGLDIDFTKYLQKNTADAEGVYTPTVPANATGNGLSLTNGKSFFRAAFDALFAKLFLKADLVNGRVPVSQAPIPVNTGIAAYSAASAYSVGNEVDYNTRIFQALVDIAANTANSAPPTDPAINTNSYWKELSGTHLQNSDTALKRLSNGLSITADWIYNAITSALTSASNATGDLLGSTYANLVIKANAITAAKLASSGAVDADRAVTTSHVRDRNITTAKIALNAVTNAELATMEPMTVKSNLTGSVANPVNTPVLNIWDGAQSQFYDSERGVSRWGSGCIYKQMADAVVSNTTVETTLINTLNAVGSNNLVGGCLLVGDRLEIESEGIISFVNGTDTFNMRLKFGALDIIQTDAFAVGAGIINRPYRLKITISVRSIGATGTLIVSGSLFISNLVYPMALIAPLVADLTIDRAASLTATWSAANAANSITAQQLAIKLI